MGMDEQQILAYLAAVLSRMFHSSDNFGDDWLLWHAMALATARCQRMGKTKGTTYEKKKGTDETYET